MKAQLETEDIALIAEMVADKLRPLLTSKREPVDSTILDVAGLADYLKVERDWVYRKAQLNEIPYYKIGKYLRFRKADIDKWANGYKHMPSIL